MKRIIGVDVDGVLANFNTAFIDLIVNVTKRDLFPPRPFDIPTWDYPEHYGYSLEEMINVWALIKESPMFWATLPMYHETPAAASYLRDLMDNGDDVYFVTNRPGLTAKVQTERWLRRLKLWPTVLISSAKAACARALKFDTYIDDRWENAVSVATTDTQSVLLNRPWNRDCFISEGIVRTDTVVGFADSPVASSPPV